MTKNYNKIVSQYKDFYKVFKEAYIGIPAKYNELKRPYYGSLKGFIKKYPNFKSNYKIPTVVFIHGSGDFIGGDIYRRLIVEEAKFAFIAPNSYAVKNRPTYKSPAPLKEYMKVHKIRQAEISYTVNRLKEFKWIDKKNLFLMGSSEGALATGIYTGKAFKGRIIIAWNCEDGYYTSYSKIGAKKRDPILAIIGTEDEYFSKNSKIKSNNPTDGHCTGALLKYKNSKVVIIPKAKHNLLENIYTGDEIVNFLDFWKNRTHS